jgi:hypothetical protein
MGVPFRMRRALDRRALETEIRIDGIVFERLTFRVGQFIIRVYSNNPLQGRAAAAQPARSL